jgi:uncharacterized sulfatase
MIAVDDLNNRIHCYGDPVVKTPNIDRLARRGIRFDRSYCNYPLCNPTRTSLLSGRRPETTRVFDNNTPPRTYLGNIQFMPEYFKSHGYFTARVGKIAHGTFEHQIHWDISESRAGVPIVQEAKLTDEDQQLARKRKQAKAAKGAPAAGKLEWTKTNRDDADEPDGATARRIVEILEKNKDKPFFIGCGFHKPHLPWVAPKKYFDMYSLDDIKLPNTPADDRDDIPPIALTFTEGDDKMTDTQRREAILAYHAATTFMDAQLGVVLDAVDRLKLWDNTVIFLFGDHGWHLYDHLQLWRKMTVFEQAARAPLIMHAPGKKEGVGCPRLVEFVDLFPTLTELCGLPQAPAMEGLSFVPLLDDPQRPWKKAAFTMVARGKDRFGRSVRTERYRYTEWDDENHSIECYDHEMDPNEWTNIAWPKRPQTAKVKAVEEELRKLLHAGYKAALPPGI